MAYMGRYELPLDKKGRFYMPSRLVDVLKAKNADRWKTLRMVCVEDYIILLDEITWQNRNCFYEKTPPAEHQTLDAILGNARTVEIGSQNRVRIPSDLIDALGLKDEAMLYGVLNTMQLLKPDKPYDGKAVTFEEAVTGTKAR